MYEKDSDTWIYTLVAIKRNYKSFQSFLRKYSTKGDYSRPGVPSQQARIGNMKQSNEKEKFSSP